MLNRHIKTLIEQSIKSFAAVLIIGARQIGKSTLAEYLLKQGLLKHYVTLDDLTMLEAATNDPILFLSQFKDETVIIDEIQRVPDLLIAIKHKIDQSKKPGQFLLTGSANILAYPNVTESLAGRVDIINLEGLSNREVSSLPLSSFIHDLFHHLSLNELIDKWSSQLKELTPLTQELILQRIFYGGFPEIVIKQDNFFSKRWFGSYQTAYIERDVRNINKSIDVLGLGRLMRLIGLQTGSLLNFHTLSIESHLDQRTVAKYINILEITFQVSQLMPWFSSQRKRLVKSSKIYMNDSGMACYIHGINSPQDLISNNSFGHLAETWAYSELRKNLALLHDIQIFFYRTGQGKEVDFVLTNGHKLWALEFKAKQHIIKQDCIGLKDFIESNPNSKGIILYLGIQIIHIEENIIAVPISIL